MIIDLGSWSLFDDDEPVKIQGYHNSELPSSRPASGPFQSYKGNQLTVSVPVYRFYVIHLDVEKATVNPAEAPFRPEDFEGSAYDYKYYHTLTSTDDGPLDVDDVDGSGVIEFVLGNCNYSSTDFQLSWTQ